MTVTLIGCGCGTESLTAEANAAIREAGVLIGAPRMLDWFPDTKTKIAAVTAQKTAEILQKQSCEHVCVLFSGDTGFYSGARLLLPLLQENMCCRVLPGISSLQLFASRIGEPWQSWRLCSAHGVDCDPVAEVCHREKAFFLTGGKTGPGELCRCLTEAGLGSLRIAIGENLGTDAEHITGGTAAELAGQDFAPLSIMLADAAPRPNPRAPGLPDTMFERSGKTPMTKQEVRATVLSKLGVGPEDTCWDIGTGTGSVAVELALQAKTVWAVDRSEEAMTLAAHNREKFGAWNMHLVAGTAPDVLKKLPVPDAVFVGGSGGKMEAILQAVNRTNPSARVCVSAIALESLENAVRTLRSLEYETEISQISVSRSHTSGDLTLMLAQNPVWLILGYRL